MRRGRRCRGPRSCADWRAGRAGLVRSRWPHVQNLGVSEQGDRLAAPGQGRCAQGRSVGRGRCSDLGFGVLVRTQGKGSLDMTNHIGYTMRARLPKRAAGSGAGSGRPAFVSFLRRACLTEGRGRCSGRRPGWLPRHRQTPAAAMDVPLRETPSVKLRPRLAGFRMRSSSGAGPQGPVARRYQPREGRFRPTRARVPSPSHSPNRAEPDAPRWGVPAIRLTPPPAQRPSPGRRRPRGSCVFSMA